MIFVQRIPKTCSSSCTQTTTDRVTVPPLEALSAAPP
jgi:hypothetical protein